VRKKVSGDVERKHRCRLVDVERDGQWYRTARDVTYVPVTRCHICSHRSQQAPLGPCSNNSPLMHHVMYVHCNVHQYDTVQYRVHLAERRNDV
jgi:hypothetical protein